MNKIQLKQFGRLASSILLLITLYFMYQERWDFMFTMAALTSFCDHFDAVLSKSTKPFCKSLAAFRPSAAPHHQPYHFGGIVLGNCHTVGILF